MEDKFIKAMQVGIYSDTNASIYHSVFAKEVLRIYQDGKDSFKDRIFGIYSLPNKWKDQNEDSHTNEQDNISGLQDKRISKIMMRGIRGIRKEDDSTYYGIDYTDDDNKICSMVLLGANGVGKTSFYSAMEVAGMGMSNCAKLRGYESDRELHKFMLNINNAGENDMILVKTGDGNVSSFGFKDKILTPISGLNICASCFCSDFDLQFLETYSYSTGKKSFTQFIHSQLNIDGFDNAVSTLKQYCEKLIERGVNIIGDSKRIDELKGEEFFLRIEHSFLNKTTQSSKIISRIKDLFVGKLSNKVFDLERIIKDGNIQKLSMSDFKLLYWHYNAEFNLICNFIFDEVHTWKISKQILAVTSENFYYQDKENIENIRIPSFYPKCFMLLNKLLRGKFSKTDLSDKTDIFKDLFDSRRKIADIIISCNSFKSNTKIKRKD